MELFDKASNVYATAIVLSLVAPSIAGSDLQDTFAERALVPLAGASELDGHQRRRLLEGLREALSGYDEILGERFDELRELAGSEFWPKLLN